MILGILAATAVPQFSTITSNAESAVADGIVGAVLSAAVIQYGVNNGSASSLSTITGAVDSSEGFTVSPTGCNASGTTSITVTVTSTSATGTGTIPAGLCNG